jgi:hypothetical protein
LRSHLRWRKVLHTDSRAIPFSLVWNWYLGKVLGLGAGVANLRQLARPEP